MTWDRSRTCLARSATTLRPAYGGRLSRSHLVPLHVMVLGVVLHFMLVGPRAVHAADGAAAAAGPPVTEEHRARATAALEMARLRYADGRYEEAAQLFREAYKLDPKPAYLYNAGRALQRAFRHEAALQCFETLLAMPNLHPDIRQRADTHRREILELRDHLEKRPAPAPLPSTTTVTAGTTKDSVGPGPRWELWSTLGGGGALTVASGVMLGIAWNRRAALDDDMDVVGGLVRGDITYASARARADAIARMKTAAVISGGIGVAALATGAWLLTRDEAEIALLPSASGVGATFVGRF